MALIHQRRRTVKSSPPRDTSDWDYRIYSCGTEAAELGIFEGLVSLWNSKRVGGGLPAWRDFRFEEFAGWFGLICVCDVTYEPIFDTHYRLWGSRVAEILGYDLTGRSPRLNSERPFEYDGGYSQVEFDYLERLAREPAIGVTAGTIHWQDRDYVGFEELTLPLADDGKGVDRLLFALHTTR